MPLNELQDYVFLTASDTFETFMVERDGAIWRLPPAPKAVFQPDHRQPPLLNWRDALPLTVRWRWRKGWLPVLEIRSAEGIMELHAAEGLMHIRKNETEAAIVDESGVHPIAQEEFMKGVIAMEREWNAFFAGVHEPAPLAGERPEAWRATIVQGLLAGCGKHPKYGIGSYHDRLHDGFPPTAIHATGLLLEMGKTELAAQRLGYYLDRFVMEDGRIDYFGPSIAEYGMLLELAARCVTDASDAAADWLARHGDAVLRIVRLLIRSGNPLLPPTDEHFPDLIVGVPEADTQDRPAIYTHNNAWAVRGLKAWSHAARRHGRLECEAECALEAQRLATALRNALEAHRLPDGLPPYRLPSEEDIASFQETRDATYANYRYYLELLESGVLTRAEALAVIHAREERDGETEGMTRFHFGLCFPSLKHLACHCADNWPIASYGIALARLGETTRLERILHAHYLHHQSRDTFTAYESVELESKGPVRHAVTDWCVPAQLAYPRLLLHHDRAMNIDEK